MAITEGYNCRVTIYLGKFHHDPTLQQPEPWKSMGFYRGIVHAFGILGATSRAMPSIQEF